jgi:PAS domain S-box-containing protein
MIGLDLDLTARKAGEEREREERLRLACEAGQLSSWDWDVATGRVTWDQSLVNHAGLQEQGFGGTFAAFWSLVHVDDRAMVEAAIRRALAGDAAYTVEFRMVRPDGSIRWTANRARVIRDDAGRPVRMVGIEADITDRKRAEAKLREGEAHLRAITDAMPQIVWSALPDGYHDYHNARWYEFTGVAPGSTDGEGWNAIFHPDDQPKAWERWRRSLATGEPYAIECRLRHHSGAYRWVLGRALPLRNPAGEIVRWMGTCTDIHDEITTREALAASRAALERANAELESRVAERTAALLQANAQLAAEMRRREAAQAALAQSQKLEALGQLTSGIAHDFNNVVTATAGGFSIIQRRTSDPGVIEIAQHGARAAARAGQLIKQLLAFARQQEPKPATIDLGTLLAEAEPLVRRSAGVKVALAIDCPQDSWPARADPHQLESALLNLAVNARDAMPDGGALRITVANCPAGAPANPPELAGVAAVAISVADTGCGMSPDVLQRVMEPFFTTKGPGKGTGLGLTMVQGFARHSGGALRIESREGRGTTVTLYLPCSGADERLEPKPSETIDPSLHGHATILLVDDDADVRAITAAQLRDLGYAVVEADDAAAALAAAADRPIDLLLTDVVMPGDDGPVLAAAIRRTRPTLPVLFMTGHADRNRLGGEVLIDKPFTLAALADAVLGLLGRGTKAAADDTAFLDRLAGRLRADGPKALLAHWRRAKGTRRLPDFADFDPAACGEPGRLVVAEVDMGRVPITFRFASVGGELEQALGRPLAGTDLAVIGQDGPVSWEAAYRRCARTGKPSHEHARLDFGDGAPELLERLLLPWSTDGVLVDRLVGLVVLPERAHDGQKSRHGGTAP